MMTDDLPDRLRHAFLDETTNARLCHEAAARIDELEAENGRIRNEGTLTMTDDLQTRLRKQNARKWRLATDGAPINSGYKSLEEEAADRIDELGAEIASLKEARIDKLEAESERLRGVVGAIEVEYRRLVGAIEVEYRRLKEAYEQKAEIDRLRNENKRFWILVERYD